MPLRRQIEQGHRSLRCSRSSDASAATLPHWQFARQVFSLSRFRVRTPDVGEQKRSGPIRKTESARSGCCVAHRADPCD